ncbi:hypothetical protein BCR32DRAFT_300338 [Anaeromyces robustus]|uniref:Uncharacterized protein n=1 Tax=Anaeromyces robustus TaxID=1754192 RepID=A0A1Y1X4F5_9FUNG|nr:hypothetical protein BCR32DRAFT_300338 [Anaeromyces robustus]|eukprot:ORX80204.1 hypothetical protein BCR32DRAFT_300338 [Anaeromyces robustus]
MAALDSFDIIEGVILCTTAQNHLKIAKKSLDKIKIFNKFNIISNGCVIGVIKKNNINKAGLNLNEVKEIMKELTNNLKSVNVPEAIIVKNTLLRIDLFFDNYFVDFLLMQSKINDLQIECKRGINIIENVKNILISIKVNQ